MKKNLTVIVALLCLTAGLIQSQAPYKVLFENWTSSTCPPCASNNPGLRAWVGSHWDNLSCVSYHVGWPSPGNDPMYLHNPVQNYDRRYYYSINAVPNGMMMGWYFQGTSPFNWASMNSYYNYYINNFPAVSSPLGMSVTDTRIPGDSNRVNISVTNYSVLPTGIYYLRVMVIERHIVYATPPGTNGETEFKHVFRLSIPNSTGTSINPAAGTYTFQFKYKINPVWNDTSIYTMAFVQDDVDKEIMNTARHGMIFTGVPNTNEIPAKFSLSQNFPNPFNPQTNIKFDVPKNDFITLKVYDIVGNEIKTLVEGNHKAGQYNVSFEGTGLASGIYFYTLKSNSFTETRKMILVK